MRYSLPQQLLRSANLHPHKTALIFAGQEMNWQQMLERTRRLAAHLQAMGIGGGDRVAVLALNSADYVCLYFALPWLGAILVPINTRLGVREMQQWLDNVQATALLHDEAHASIAGELSTQNPDLSLLPIAAIADDPMASAIEPVDADDYPDAMIFHTGGTTGVAKGVVLQQEALLVNSMQWCVATGCNASDTFLISPPMFHLVAGMNTIASAMLGATLVVLPRFETALVLDSIARYGVSKAAMVPAMLEMLFADPDFANADLRALKKISYGGAAISPDLLRRSLTHLPGIQFYQIYGQTECCGTVSCLGPEHHALTALDSPRLRSAGQPVSLSEVSIRAPDGTLLGTGEVGEICVRGPSTMARYWNNPQASAELYRTGWLHTGDAGYLDEDGFLFIVDRIKDMIISGGENVFAQEVEAVLYQLGSIEQCAVIGIPSPRWGEEVHAVVFLKPGASLSAEQVISHCRGHLGAFKCPRSVRFSETPLPASAVGKILKRVLREQFAGNE